jgi:hypothetical protein
MVNFQVLSPPMNNANGVITGVRQDTQGDDIRVKAKTSGVQVRGVGTKLPPSPPAPCP